ncbi:MAG: ASKHA domain-containing protein [Oscillospiraceae bacterium]
MSTYTITVTHNGETRNVAAKAGDTFLSALRNAGYTSINAPCGGNGICRQCRVNLEGREVLACQTKVDRDCSVTLRDTHKMEIVTRGAVDITPCGTGLGVAVDVGTTTVASYLYDLETGRLLEIESGRNAQRPYGADVLSRIQYTSKEGGLEKLSGIIRNQLNQAIERLCARAGRETREVKMVSIAGNTVMEHILAGFSPVGIGVAPFTTVSLFGDMRPASQVLEGLAEDARLYLCPALAGYVGGDITAGMLSSGIWKEKNTCLFLDIGTNGEMALGDSGGFTCCATAAGPAFEGAEIECGMDATVGAINRVSYVNQRLEFTVIGGGVAKGICGSGLTDALAAMLRCGAVEESGRMVRPEEASEHIRERLKADEKGQMRFYLTDKVFVSAADVRQIQLAKSAIRAGIETLMEIRGKTYDDIEKVIIAGGFGAYMRVESACTLGLLPPALMGKTKHVGNSAGAGAAMALVDSNRQLLREITAKCEYLELSASALFYEKYIEAMTFNEAGTVDYEN